MRIRKGSLILRRRLKKLLQPGTKTFHRQSRGGTEGRQAGQYIADVAAAVKKRMAEHGGKTLVIMNTVRRACALAEKMKDNKPLLLHSRFRHRERKAWTSKVKDANFIIATQVIEAGLDITSRVLFSESCPWPSFIQRCGRAARYPDDPKADVYWLDVTKDSLPYSEEELAEVKGQFASLTDVSLAGFSEHRKNLAPEPAQRLLPYAPRFVPQAKDILDLFDTTPDLTGADIDISRYIRDGEEHDITAFWRDCSTIPKGKDPPKAKAWQPEHAELCPVPVFSQDSGFRNFAQKTQGRIWRWDYRDGWTRLNRGDAERIFPGQVFLLEQSCGGYDPEKVGLGVRTIVILTSGLGNNRFRRPQSLMKKMKIPQAWETISRGQMAAAIPVRKERGGVFTTIPARSAKNYMPPSPSFFQSQTLTKMRVSFFRSLDDSMTGERRTPPSNRRLNQRNWRMLWPWFQMLFRPRLPTIAGVATNFARNPTRHPKPTGTHAALASAMNSPVVLRFWNSFAVTSPIIQPLRGRTRN